MVAGLPYRCASSIIQAFSCQSPGTDLSPRQWGDKVRAASTHTGPWPKVSVWHGTSDTVNGYPHRTYRDPAGRTVVESRSLTGMAHGQPIDPGTGPTNCGRPAPYILDVNICAAYQITSFWGLT